MNFVHLRREGPEGNIGNFNMMVQNVSGVMEQERIEMVPQVRE